MALVRVHNGPRGERMRIRRIKPDPLRVPIERTQARRGKSRQGEHQEQVALIQWATMQERNVPPLKNLFAIPNGGDRHFAVAAKLKASGVKRGVADLFLAWPVRVAGVIDRPGLYIEMKFGKNKLSTDQVDWKNRLIAAGYAYWVCYSWKEAANVIIEYLGGDFARYRVA